MPETPSVRKHQWWKEAVVYQIYPASFLSKGAGSRPGWGDLKGITSKVDYLKDLGVDVVWLSPIYKSPQADMGYDIADYKDVDPLYGSLQDVDELIRELKSRDMKLMMDLVVNHTSEEHAWFKDSRSSKTSKKRDWYMWKPAKYDEQGNRQPPNNWSQILGEANSAWTWDEGSQEYYLSLFTPEQPDLNWENPAVREAVHDVLKFWLDRGVSGFRMDVINLISKVEGFPDAPISVPGHQYQPGFMYFANGPRLHEFLDEVRKKVLNHYDTITVGEMPFVRDEDEIIKIVGEDRGMLNMIFLFALVDIDNDGDTFRLTLRDWKPCEIKQILTGHQRLMMDRDGWNSLFVENHDQPRAISRFCDDDDKYREISSRLLSLMETTLAGTLYVYQGLELGMRNVPPSWGPEEYKDIESTNYWAKMNKMYPNDKEKLAFARKVLQLKARDNARTPVQWTAGKNAGFCDPSVTPWMRVNDDYETVNAEAQQKKRKEDDGLSPLQFWKRGLSNRKQHKDVFVYGDYELLSDDDTPIFAYKRSSAKEAFVVVLNFCGQEESFTISTGLSVSKWVTTTYNGSPSQETKGKVTLRPWEGLLGTVQM